MKKGPASSDPLSQQLHLRAAYLKEMGLGYVVDRPELHPPPPAAEVRAVAAPQASAPAGPAVRIPRIAIPEGAGGAASLKAIREAMGECTLCRLSQGRTQIVFGVGNPNARVMFVGEGPGEEEDRQGIPFVGRAGQLLTDIITKGMGLKREDVYIANVVKCRPPQNRTPEPDEMATCQPFLRSQILAIGPAVIVALGRPAAHTLLGPGIPITRLRGNWGIYEGIPVMPTFHPAYLLRSPSAKKEVWEDIQKVLAKLGMGVPGK